MYNGKTKLICRHLGFLIHDYNMKFKFQTFKFFHEFYGPIDTYSFYNHNGCFTLHNVVQKGEWGIFVSSKFSEDQYQLLAKEIFLEHYLPNRSLTINGFLKKLAVSISEQLERNNSFFGINI